MIRLLGREPNPKRSRPSSRIHSLHSFTSTRARCHSVIKVEHCVDVMSCLCKCTHISDILLLTIIKQIPNKLSLSLYVFQTCMSIISLSILVTVITRLTNKLSLFFFFSRYIYMHMLFSYSFLSIEARLIQQTILLSPSLPLFSSLSQCIPTMYVHAFLRYPK